MIPEQRNFKLYKHKKQWMTACATFLLTFGATAVMNVSASANTDNTSNGGSTPKIAEVVKAASVNSSQEKSNNAQPVTETSDDPKEEQTVTASSAGQSTTNKETAAKSKQAQTAASQPTQTVNSAKATSHSATVATSSASSASSATHPTSSPTAKVNIAQKVNFEFVDEYKNDQVVGQPYSQEFIPGVATKLNFNMAMPDGYELGNGASIPSQYTLTAFSQTTPVVQVPIHQKMHFYITFHDEDSNTNLGTVKVSGSTAGNGGYDPYVVSQLKFPDGANATNYQSISTSGVPDGVQLLGSYGVPLTDPKAVWTTPNYRWENTFSVLKALTGANMTINLKHKINTTQERQTRTATVNYVKAKVNADGTYTQDGSAAQSAVLDVY